jgi:alkanesulfonate monooxygenase SsuD/methylene tetrahydromethanopterin reductase-like flavin-dependent oxidoreductase (luciferase family)
MPDHLPSIGFQVWGQFTDWPAMAATARAIEDHGFASLWSNDHFFPAAGRAAATADGIRGPVLEGWMTAAGFAMVTRRIPVGVLVSGAGYREAGLLVKMATSLDHLSGGRGMLGLGAGWHVRDHEAFGFPLPGVRQRLDRLDARSSAIRALLDGRVHTTSGPWVTMRDAVDDPRPLGPMPLMIGGSGLRRTLRIVARDADAWNGEGDPVMWAERSATLDRHCAELGRDPRSIRRTVGAPPVRIRDSAEEARRSLTDTLVRNGLDEEDARATAQADPLAGTIDEVLRIFRAYASVGAAEIICDWPAPYDEETLERLAAVLDGTRA